MKFYTYANFFRIKVMVLAKMDFNIIIVIVDK